MRAGFVVIIGVLLLLTGVAVMYWPAAVALAGLLLIAAGMVLDLGDFE